jgi:hypothetical protein
MENAGIDHPHPAGVGNGDIGHLPQDQAEDAAAPEAEAAAHELNNCRASLPFSVTCHPFANYECSWFHVKICVIAGIGFFTDA